jgi:Cobalamin synthesis protein cobW C-terminal domain
VTRRTLQEWPEDLEERAYVAAEFKGEWGDRRQELVFIGCKMDEPFLRKQLESALLTDAELLLGPEQWATAFADVLPQWDVAAADEAAELTTAVRV